MAMVICASVVIAALAVGAGWMGSHQHLGFTLVSRRFVRYSGSIQLDTYLFAVRGVCEGRFGQCSIEW